MFNLAQEVGAGVFIHPLQVRDLENDTHQDRRELRLRLLQKYRQLPSPPPVNDRVLEAANRPDVSSNTWIDVHLAAALDACAVDYVVSEDHGLHKVCRRLGLEDRCLSLLATLDLLGSERTVIPSAPPAVEAVAAHQLVSDDSIFDGLRAEYPSFDEWLDRCKREHRRAWVIHLPGISGYAGIAIVNPENREWTNARNPTLKICTFKISERATGGKLGELLLRAVFDFAHENRMETLFIETFPKQGALLRLLHQFGFEVEHEKPGTKELMLRKRMSPVNTEDERLNPSEFARKFGPFSVKWSQTTGFVIPIEPRFYALLFPELEPQGVLMPGSESFGNTLIKAYLCRAQTRSIRPGDLVFFYRSGDWQAIGTAGVIEQTLSSDSEVKMAEFLRKRTVYQQQDIALKCREGGALGLTFRHAPVIRRLIHLHKLVSNGVIAGPPQSITKLSSTALSWLQAHQSSHSFRSNPTTRTRSSTGERRSSFGSDRSKGLSRMS